MICIKKEKRGRARNDLKSLVFVILFIFVFLGIKIILLPPDNQEDFSFKEKDELSSLYEQAPFYFLVGEDGSARRRDEFSMTLFLSPTEKASIELPDFLLINQNNLQAVSPPTIFSPRVLSALIGGIEEQKNRNAIIEYVVEAGDSLWSIAAKFGISVDTIVWANDLKRTIIRPGQRLIILPVSGVRHIVKEEDTVSAIAEKYGGIETGKLIDFNNLSDEGFLFVGQSLIIPGGTKPRVISTVATADIDITALTPSQVRAKFSTNNYWGQSHSFPFGQCTWWVAQKRPIPRWGHARDWLRNAQAAGFQVCRGRYCLPQRGAIIVVRGNPIFGHVAYVEDIKGSKVIFSEMNNIGLGRINKRTVKIGDPIIIGYIF